MSTTDSDSNSTLDAATIREQVAAMEPEEFAIFREVIVEIRSLGSSISDAQVGELAKKYADKARRLAGDGGSQ